MGEEGLSLSCGISITVARVRAGRRQRPDRCPGGRAQVFLVRMCRAGAEGDLKWKGARDVGRASVGSCWRPREAAESPTSALSLF